MLIRIDNDMWIGYIKDDPVRPHISPYFRITENRTTFALMDDDEYAPRAIICVAFTSDVATTAAATVLPALKTIADVFYAVVETQIESAASNADAHHVTAPAPSGVGAIQCMELALADAGLEPVSIRQINAHGTSTPLNDAAEGAAITSVFGERAVPVVSTKGVTGHALGAAGALEAAAVLLSMHHSLIPPTANTTNVDSEMTVDVVTGSPRPWEPGPTMSNNFGFGGHNGSVIIGTGADHTP